VVRTKAVPVVTIGLVGAGFLSETRARCYAACRSVMAEVVGVAARHQGRADDFARRWDVPCASDDYRSLLDDPTLDIIDVCTPNTLHAEIVTAAARAGKHVICTKPLTGYFGGPTDPARIGNVSKRLMYAHAVAEAEAMVRAADEAGVKLMYAENWVYAPAIQRARGLLEASGGTILNMQRRRVAQRVARGVESALAGERRRFADPSGGTSGRCGVVSQARRRCPA